MEKEQLNKKVGTQVVVMSRTDGMMTLWLPAFPQGNYTFTGNGRAAQYLRVEARGDSWHLVCKRPMQVVHRKGKGTVTSCELTHRRMYRLSMPGWQGVLLCEDENRQGQVFHNYLLRKNSITIGRLPDNDIVCPYAFVNDNRVSIVRQDDSWYIDDPGESNHVYLNNQHVGHAPLAVGDSIYIVGVRMLFGNGFISINSGDGRARVNPNTLQPVRLPVPAREHGRPDTTSSDADFFSRRPRRLTPINAQPIEVEGPPMPLNGDKLPLLLRVGGTLAHGGTSLLMGNFVSLLASVVFPLLSRGYTEKERKEYEERRVAFYTDYLKETSRTIADEIERERKALETNYPSTEKVVTEAGQRRHLWGRRTVDSDFLNVRLGVGMVPLMSQISYPRRRYDMDRDPLEEQMYALVEKEYTLSNAPIITSLIENTSCGIVGDEMGRLLFAQTVMMQIASQHSYDELKIVVLADKSTLQKLFYVRYLPHVWDDGRSIRLVASDIAEAYQVSEYLRQQLGEDLDRPRKLPEILRDRPYYLVFAFDKRLFDSMEVFKEALRNEATVGMGVVAAFNDLPKETSQLVTLIDSQHATLTHLRNIELKDDAFVPDILRMGLIRRTAHALANTELKIAGGEAALPESVTFLEVFGIGRIETLNPVKRWADSDPSKSLAAPVGLASDGSTFTLDLHEKHEGPHGLIAGMTGSGKSEFILSYVLSMAVSYHPDEVAFLLIDYKGGGLAGTFSDEKRGVHLPHVVGTVTNLDGSAVQRVMVSINSELRRRQRIFNEVRSAVNAETMDIYKYQRLYRQGVVSEPLPHLFIVSDEFAELKQQVPEFMAELISAARIGRSLGVHLILATQKPAGVVNDQILSNTKFRVCLKVQDRADSMDVLKRPDAAELQQVGRFYLQVGYNELFAIGQSAYSGAPYVPTDEVTKGHTVAVRVVDTTGQVISEAKPEEHGIATGKSQLVEVVELLTEVARRMGVRTRQLWCDPLPEVLDVNELNDSSGARPIGEGSSTMVASEAKDRIVAQIGVIDDVPNQRRLPLTIDFTGMRNTLVVGSVQSGKSTLLQTMVFMLAQRYSPQQVNFYILDFSNKTLMGVSGLPHCGAALHGDDEDKLDDFFGLLDEIVEERRQLFEELKVNTFEDARRLLSLPLILVLIDNVAGLSGTKAGKAYYDGLSDRMRRFFSFGVKFVVTCNSLTGEMTQRMLKQLGNRICLGLDDKYAYREALGTKCDFAPPILPGRGMYVYEEEPLEIHIARFLSKIEGRERAERLRGLCQELCMRYDGLGRARTLPTIPEAEEYSDFARQFELGRFPLGYAEKDAKPVAIPLCQMPVMSIYFGNPWGVRPIWNNLMCAAQRESMDVVVMRAKRGSVFPNESSDHLLAPTPEGIRLLGEKIVGLMASRKPLLVQYCAEHELDVSASDLGSGAFDFLRTKTRSTLVVFERFADVCANAEEAVVADFAKLFSVARKYNVFFIAGFYPDDDVVNNPLFRQYNPSGLCMLFGGRHDKQQLVQFPYGYAVERKATDYNKAVMQYRESLYGLVMPCGTLLTESEDAEERNIFSH